MRDSVQRRGVKTFAPSGVPPLRREATRLCENAAACRCEALLKPDRITATDRAAPRDDSIYADVDLVMLGGRAKDSRIRWKIPLCKSCHHATPARNGDV